MTADNMKDTALFLALNMSKVVNSEESFNLMRKVRPRMRSFLS